MIHAALASLRLSEYEVVDTLGSYMSADEQIPGPPRAVYEYSATPIQEGKAVVLSVRQGFIFTAVWEGSEETTVGEPSPAETEIGDERWTL